MGMKKRENEIFLVNMVLENEYTIENQPYHYLFFKIEEEDYPVLKTVKMKIRVFSGQAVLILNEYRNTEHIRLEGNKIVEFPANQCESGENVLAYKGEIEIESVSIIRENSEGQSVLTETGNREKQRSFGVETGIKAAGIRAAAEFLLNSQIPFCTGSSQFEGSCFAIYDYTNGCHRMPAWLWSDAPAVSAALAIIRSGKYPELKEKLEQLALSIGETFLKTQIKEEAEETCGALVSRYRYYGKTQRSFDCLLGPNDTSFSVKWALLPLYEYTGEERYLHAALKAMDWVERCVYGLDYIPSHYYFEEKRWEGQAFVDTGFCAEGFSRCQEMGLRDYKKTIEFLMTRFLEQFSLGNGWYGQNYIPGKGVDTRLFTRGQAWVLEGLLACRRALGQGQFEREAENLVAKMICMQNPDGSFSYLLGHQEPMERDRKGSGICEKATAIFAWLFLEYDRLYSDTAARIAASKALAWCEHNMTMEKGAGYGGIRAAGLASGITGLPFLKVATGYANAYYILAKLMQR